MCAALSTDYLTHVGSPGTATTLAAPGHTIGGTSITVVSTTNWPTDTGVIFAMDTVSIVNGEEVRDVGSYTEWEAVVSGATSITSMVLRYGTDQNYPAGSTSRVYIPVASSRENRLVDGILVSHNQDGTIKSNIIATGMIIDDAVTDDKILVDPRTTRYELLGDFLSSGCVWSTSASLQTSMTAGVVYVNGRRFAVTQVTNRAFTASKDTYVDILDNLNETYTLVYTEVANLGAEPALAANSMRIALVRTTGTTVSVVLTGRVVSGAINPAGVYPMSPVNPLKTQKYKFHAYRSGSQSVNTGDTLINNVERFDLNNNHDTSNGRYTAPVAGFYQFNGAAIAGGANFALAVELQVNGATQVFGSQSVTDTEKVNVSGMLYLGAGDYANLLLTENYAGAISVTGGHFSGYFISS